VWFAKSEGSCRSCRTRPAAKIRSNLGVLPGLGTLPYEVFRPHQRRDLERAISGVDAGRASAPRRASRSNGIVECVASGLSPTFGEMHGVVFPTR
jgi:hypothetical protein